MSKDVDIEELSAKHEDLIAVILSEEEELINDHRKMIDQMVDMIKHEMSMLTEVDQPGSDVDHYAQELDKILSLKEDMIRSLREKVRSFNTHLREEEEMSKFFNELQKEEMDLFDLSKQEEDLLEDFS